jgi:outer membrane protein TolC
VENGLITFLNSRREAESLAGSVKAAQRTIQLTTAQWNAGAIDFTPVFVAQQFLAQDQIQYTQAVGDVALGLIAVYRALGGGWELRLTDQGAQAGGAPAPCAPVAATLGPPVPPPGQ